MNIPRRQILLVPFLFVMNIGIYPDEGMWIPLLLEHLNISDMQEKGLKLSAEDIYSINQACLKDAIVIFGEGCTGEIVSGDGLMFTNHHCGHSFVQSHSDIENNYLENGFWAMSREEELPNPGLTVSILVSMEDVTEKILNNIPEGLSEENRNAVIEYSTSSMVDSITKNSDYEAIVRPFYYGNEYYLFLYEVYKDIRLVGAPPSSIGKFGGDTDNWIWPRHTGDFSIFRIYAGKDNKPAPYSTDNVPYQPKKFLSISLRGIEEGDFTMVYGYPYFTEEYITSYAVDQLINDQLPYKIKLREERLKILEHAMKTDPGLWIKFASEQASIANEWKKWIGMEKGLRERDAIHEKLQFEQDFITWALSESTRNIRYAGLLNAFHETYTELKKYALVYDYGHEVVMASSLFDFVSVVLSLINENYTGENTEGITETLKTRTQGYFNKVYMPVEKESFGLFMSSYYNDIAVDFHPSSFNEVEKKFDGDFDKYLEYLFNQSLFSDQQRMMGCIEDFSIKKIRKDPLFILFYDFVEVYSEKVYPAYTRLSFKIDSLSRLYMKGIMEMSEGKKIYPDANGTLRLTYGKAEGYEPSDGVQYTCLTTLEGIMEKEKMGVYDYQVPEGLKMLYEEKDYGRYGMNKTLPVCFLASNHTTGGNSGSPVLNGDGQLIGINFDRNWEGTMSDIIYHPAICRNISVDIRYVLFIIDKYAGAGYLTEEMDIVE